MKKHIDRNDSELSEYVATLSEPILGGKYRHYKNKKLYEVIGKAYHSETCEEMIVYRALYYSDKFGTNQLWVRPMQMFFEEVIHHGQTVPRFQRIGRLIFI